jgi:triacylglycerol lipase
MVSGKHPVVLVHGLWNTVNIFWRLRTYLEAQGWPVYAFNLVPNNGDVGIEQLAQQMQSFVHTTLGHQQSFDLVGFSMGGLISRYYLQNLGGVARVTRFISVATPHYGSTLAWFAMESRRGTNATREPLFTGT